MLFRSELYHQMVELLLVRWQEARLGADAGISRQIKLSEFKAAMARVAFEVHRNQGASSGTADIGEALLLSVFKDYLDGSYDRARQLVTFIQQRADLLIWRGPELYTFPHRSYQEFLAGTHLAAQGDFPQQLAGLVRDNYRQWREVALWAVEVAARAGFVFHGMAAVEALCPGDVPAHGSVSDDQWRLASLAGEGILGIGLQAALSTPPDRAKTERVRQWLSQCLERSALPARERVEAGAMLARLGDPRAGVTTLDGMEFCLVPKGPFWLGSAEDDEAASAREKPLDEVNLDAYWLARYPATVAQFREYVERSGQTPEDLDSLGGLSNHPVVWVSRRDALALCEWLTADWQMKGLIPPDWCVRLPSEAEWEKAARGGREIPSRAVIGDRRMRTGQVDLIANPDPNREYPWLGAADLERANYDKVGAFASAVGCFPKGASPHGCEEMAGNVWEWTLGGYAEYRDDPKVKAVAGKPLGRGEVAVVRGGASWDGSSSMRCAYRGRDDPELRGGDIGFRVVLSPFLRS